MPLFSLEKCVQGSYNQSHPTFGETEDIQCASNVLLAKCWLKVREVSCWCSFDLDHVLDLGDNLLKNLALNRYLDASDLPEHLSLDDYPCDINLGHLHYGEVNIGARFLLYLFLPTGRSAALLLIDGTVKATIFHARSYYAFDSNSRGSRGFSVSNRTSILRKFSRLEIKLKLYI